MMPCDLAARRRGRVIGWGRGFMCALIIALDGLTILGFFGAAPSYLKNYYAYLYLVDIASCLLALHRAIKGDTKTLCPTCQAPPP